MAIRSKTLRWLIILSTLLVAIIIMVQLFWLQKVYRFERKQFNIGATRSIKDLFINMHLSDDSVFTFEKNIELPQPTNYLTRIDRIPDIDSVANAYSKELTDFNLLTDCEVSIFDVQQKKYIGKKYIDIPDSYTPSRDKYQTPLFNRDYSYLGFNYPHRSRYIIMQMFFWIVSAIILLVVLISFAVSIFYLYRQQFLNETQKDFVNNFAHEFKTPLSVIKIATDVLRQPSIVHKPDKLQNYADIIGGQTEHLQSQLNRLLIIAYTEHTRLTLQKEAFAVNQLLQQAVRNIYPLLEEKTGAVDITLEGKDPIINADKSYLLLAFVNLLENAVKYADKPVIKIKTYIERGDCCVSITDNGIGIDKKQQRKIFRKFYRVTYGDIHRAKGFGLGLNLVKKIAEAHRGSILVNSSPGSGSTFTFKVPIG